MKGSIQHAVPALKHNYHATPCAIVYIVPTRKARSHLPSYVKDHSYNKQETQQSEKKDQYTS
jgi:hypothetical protein